MTKSDVIIVGGGPAGSTAATLLASFGFKTLLLETKAMPRPKLCGEFITPECFPTLARLGVMEDITRAGARRINRLSLCLQNGTVVDTPFANISSNGYALGLSRARLDQILFERAIAAGAECLDGMAVKQAVTTEGVATGVEALSLASGTTGIFHAPIIIDASGRNSRLMFTKRRRVGGRPGSRVYALKAHLSGVEGIEDQVELHFFREGYGGLSRVENGLVNLCFTTSEHNLKRDSANPMNVVRHSFMRSPLAAKRLANATVEGKWLSTGPLSFGQRGLTREGIIAVGDAGGMIDPFTGTGIQVAIRSAEILADSLAEVVGATVRKARDTSESVEALGFDAELVGAFGLYQSRYTMEFKARMRAAAVLRIAAFSPSIAHTLANLIGHSPWLVGRLLRSTRRGANTRRLSRDPLPREP